MADVFELDYLGGLRIGRGLTEEMLLQFQDTHQLKRRDMKTGWIWYRLPDWVQGSLIIGVELAFHNGTLESIHFYPRGESESDEIDSWKDLSEEKERLRAEAAASWLRARGFPLGRYKWGEVWAGYDAKGAVGLGLVRYSP